MGYLKFSNQPYKKWCLGGIGIIWGRWWHFKRGFCLIFSEGTFYLLKSFILSYFTMSISIWVWPGRPVISTFTIQPKKFTWKLFPGWQRQYAGDDGILKGGLLVNSVWRNLLSKESATSRPFGSLSSMSMHGLPVFGWEKINILIGQSTHLTRATVSFWQMPYWLGLWW